LQFDHGYDWDRMNLTKTKMLHWIKFLPLEEQLPVDPPLSLESLDARSSMLTAQVADLDGRLAKIEKLPWHRQFFPVIKN